MDLNRNYNDSQALKESVSGTLELAHRIALFPRTPRNQTKSRLLGLPNPPNDAFQLDFQAFHDGEQGPEQQPRPTCATF